MDDLISRQAVLKLKFSNGIVKWGVAYIRVDELVNKLKALPTIQPVATDATSDTISRQAALKEVEEWRKSFLELCHNESASDVKFIRGGIEQLPSVQPEQKTATWLIRKWGDDAKCSNCGHTFKDVYDMDNHDRFCRFCGSKMVGVKMYEISDRKVQGM